MIWSRGAIPGKGGRHRHAKKTAVKLNAALSQNTPEAKKFVDTTRARIVKFDCSINQLKPHPPKIKDWSPQLQLRLFLRYLGITFFLL